jgi:hypothetical protein
MHIVAVTSVKNEIDIIEAFVRHTLACVDHLVALDNGSSDGTLAVLQALQAEGLALDIIEDPSPGMYQWQRMTRLMREWALERYDAAWVMPLDADEFLQPGADGSLVPSAAIGDRPIALPWRSYVPCAEDDPAEANPVVRIRSRLKHESCAWVKVLVPAKLAGRPDAALSQGSHDLLLGGQPVAAARSEGACLAHFPLRSPGQYLAKIAMNTLQYQSMPDRRIDAGWHYREPYDLLRRDPQAFQESFFEAARRYAWTPGSDGRPDTICDPLPYRGGLLRHTRTVDDTTRGWLAVLAVAEDLAQRQAALLASLDEHQRVSLDRLAAVLTRIHAHFAEQYQIGLSWHGQLMQAQQQLQHLHLQARQAHEQTQQAQRQAHAAHEQAQRQAAEQLRERQAVENSWTWRAGRLIIGPLQPLKRLAAAFRLAA